jgi:hypothetical protein
VPCCRASTGWLAEVQTDEAASATAPQNEQDHSLQAIVLVSRLKPTASLGSGCY